MAETEQDRIRLKRTGGPGAPSRDPVERAMEQESRDMNPPPASPPQEEMGEGEGDVLSSEPVDQTLPVYDLELVIYTVSGHKYSARLNFKSDVEKNRMTVEKAREMIQKVEHDIRNRTFQRPITYSDTGSGGATVEYIFNPENVECVGIVRKY